MNKDQEKVQSESGFEKPPLKVILLCTGAGIFGIIVLIHNITSADYWNNEDIFNWVSLVVEIGIGIGITVTVWRYTKYEQTKTNKLISDIKSLTNKLDKVIEQEQGFQKDRKSIVINNLSAYLSKLGVQFQLIMAHWKESEKIGYWTDDLKEQIHDKEDTIKRLEDILVFSVGAINQAWIHETREICDQAKKSAYVRTGEERMNPTDCKFLISRINDLMSKIEPRL